MAEKIPAYNGEGKYVFVSYAHKDSRVVYPVILSLHEQGYNVWYDEGIPLVVNYGGELYRRIKGCSVFLLFVSKNSVASDDVNKEVENAFALKKTVVRINIDDSPMRDSWCFHIPPTSQYISIDAEPGEFYGKVCAAISECRGGSTKPSSRMKVDPIDREPELTDAERQAAREHTAAQSQFVAREKQAQSASVNPEDVEKAKNSTGFNRKALYAVAAVAVALIVGVAVWTIAGSGESAVSGEPQNNISINAWEDEVDSGMRELLEGPQGKVFNIYAWNEEFKDLFEEYYDVPEDITVVWTISDYYEDDIAAHYQADLDEALINQDQVPDDEKVDMFLMEPDYMIKYVDSEYTMDIGKIGFENADTMYRYTVDAATDSNGATKGVCFQCSPSAFIYRRSIAKDVLGTDDPAEVQAAVEDWDKFMETAERMAAKGYYMTESNDGMYRAFSNNCSIPWVDDNNNLQFDDGIEKWIDMTKTMFDCGYTARQINAWAGTEQGVDGRAFCYFGPSWFYNYCMSNAGESRGDWAICGGPEAWSWGGTWLLAAAGSDNPAMLKDIFETFTINEGICSKLVTEQGLHANNMTVVDKYAIDPACENDFLGGQYDLCVLDLVARQAKWENKTIYDQWLDEFILDSMYGYFTGEKGKNEALDSFYEMVRDCHWDVVLPQ